MNKTLSKIDKYLNKLEERKNTVHMYTVEDLDVLGIDEEVKERLVEAMKKRKVGGPEYDKFFTKMLKKWKIKSYKDLPKDKQDDFFNAVDKAWNSKKEKGKDGEV